MSVFLAHAIPALSISLGHQQRMFFNHISRYLKEDAKKYQSRDTLVTTHIFVSQGFIFSSIKKRRRPKGIKNVTLNCISHHFFLKENLPENGTAALVALWTLDMLTCAHGDCMECAPAGKFTLCVCYDSVV
jgi:hypothetical protein